MAGIGEFPQYALDTVLNPDDNTPGIHGVRFFIRGHPWVISMDSHFLSWKDGYQSGGVQLGFVFTKEDRTDKVIWPALLEKAYAKAKGNYVIAEGGYLIEGLRALTGLPGFSYKTNKIGTDSGDLFSADDCFTMLKTADTNNYIMALGTAGSGNDQQTNTCGIAMSHAYTILAAFEMTESGTTHKMLMIRNPWGSTQHTGPKWQHGDAAWTSSLKGQVPLSIDVDTARDVGIFFMEMDTFAAGTCVDNFAIMHKISGYSTKWYDKEDNAVDIEEQKWEITVPANIGTKNTVYVQTDGYPNHIDSSCFSGTYVF